MNKLVAMTYVAVIMSASSAASAQDAAEDEAVAKTSEPVTALAQRLELDTTSVTGNRELPKVLVIVPWKNPELAELTGRPLASLVEEALGPVDPDVFRRQVSYYNALKDADAPDAAANEDKQSSSP